MEMGEERARVRERGSPEKPPAHAYTQAESGCHFTPLPPNSLTPLSKITPAGGVKGNHLSIETHQVLPTHVELSDIG